MVHSSWTWRLESLNSSADVKQKGACQFPNSLMGALQVLRPNKELLFKNINVEVKPTITHGASEHTWLFCWQTVPLILVFETPPPLRFYCDGLSFHLIRCNIWAPVQLRVITVIIVWTLLDQLTSPHAPGTWCVRWRQVFLDVFKFGLSFHQTSSDIQNNSLTDILCAPRPCKELKAHTEPLLRSQTRKFSPVLKKRTFRKGWKMSGGACSRRPTVDRKGIFFYFNFFKQIGNVKTKMVRQSRKKAKSKLKSK